MRILVTNDDGVGSAGLLALKQALAPLGEVSVVAPDRNRSAIARSITIGRPVAVEPVELADGSEAHAVDGTPVDCVRLAALGLVGEPPDLVVSGINLGVNLGDDVTYSGTVAAAFEGVLLGLPAIAVSQQAVGTPLDRWDGSSYDFRAVAAFAARLVPMVVRECFPRRVLLNVNAPGASPGDVRGARVTRLGRRTYRDRRDLHEQNGRTRRYWIYGEPHPEPGGPGTDLAAVAGGHISVTPLHFDLTDLGGMSAMERWDLGGLHLASPVAVEDAGE